MGAGAQAAAVFGDAGNCQGWPENLDEYMVYHTEGVFDVRNANVAIAPTTTLLLFRLHK